MKEDDSVVPGLELNRPRREAFAGWPMIVGWAAMLTATFYACTHMVAAGDTWVAMACGRHFVNHGVNTVEPFSANSHKAGPTEADVQKWPKWARWITNKVGLETVRYWHPTGWVNQNWLTHVIFYKLATGLGSEQQPYYDALILWKFAIYILAAVCLYFTARLYGVNRVLAVLFVSAALYIGRSFLDVRPAGFSNLLVAVFVLVLALASYRNHLFIWLLVPLVVFWANVHGGYIYAFLMLTPFVVWHAIMNLPKRWALAAYSMLTWLVLWGMASRVSHHEYLKPIALSNDWAIYLLVLAVAGSVLLTRHRQVSDGGLIAYHATVSGILFLLLLTRFYPAIPLNLGGREKADLQAYIAGSRIAYLGMFTLAMVIGAIVAGLRDRVVHVMKPRAILHTVGAGVVAFVAMVIFNPFHLTNLTHTFEISVSAHAERWRDVHEWHRALDWTNPVGTAIPFLVLYILGWLCLAIWVSFSIYTTWLAGRPTKRRKAAAVEDPWLRMDVGLLVIAALTIYLAIRSRRFIPIAAFTACPVLALVIQETAGRLMTMIRLRRQEKTALSLSTRSVTEATALGAAAAIVVFGLWCLLLQHWLFVPMPGNSDLIQPHVTLIFIGIALAVLAFISSTKWYVTAGGADTSENPAAGRASPVKTAVLVASLLLAGLVLVAAISVGWRFKLVYLDPWPADTRFTSVFMRMTASDAKPFDACEFIRRNKLCGKMFNYWTEGGFIAWGQDPDPNTGRTPLQLFMDGRAQAAYNVPTFDLWTHIMTGGPVVRRAVYAHEELTAKDYVEIGDWISEQLRKQNVWVVLMPAGQFDKPFVKGLDYRPSEWPVAYLDDKQKLFVDVNTPQGRELFQNIFDGKTIFPNDYTANLTLGHNLLLLPDSDQRERGLNLIIKAFDENPSLTPMIEMLFIGARYPELAVRIDQVCVRYAADFAENKATYAARDGYNLRLEAARLAMLRLAQVARAQGDSHSAESYADTAKQYEHERNVIAGYKRW